MNLLEIQHITKKFHNHTALDGVSINIPREEIFGLLGPNGAGKTTLIRIINQIINSDSGKIFFDGEQLKQKHIYQIGYLPEERGLYKKMKVAEQVLYLSQLKGLKTKEAKKRLKAAFEKFEISAWWDKKVEELSKGMQQKIQFITTIIHHPKLLIFDEPFSGFDPINAEMLKQEIINLKNNGSTIIFSTHNMSSVEEICDNIALLDNAKKILEGSIQEIKEKYKSNTYKLKFKNEKTDFLDKIKQDYKVLKINKDKTTKEIFIKSENFSKTKDLINSFFNFADLSSFEEQLPSMNEIFINLVKKNDKSNKN